MLKKTTVLLVDDDSRLIRFVRANLEVGGYRVLVAQEGNVALGLIDKEMPDLVILDVMMPGMDGFELCQRIRESTSIPIIMLTARAEEGDKVRGLQLGADDYLTKPFGVQELLARVEAILRRARFPEETRESSTLTFGDLSIDLLRRQVKVRGNPVEFTPTEYRLLHYLATNADKVVSHEELLAKVWGPEYRDEIEYLRSYVNHLRKKIEVDPANPCYLHCKTGFGYFFSPQSAGELAAR